MPRLDSILARGTRESAWGRWDGGTGRLADRDMLVVGLVTDAWLQVGWFAS